MKKSRFNQILGVVLLTTGFAFTQTTAAEISRVWVEFEPAGAEQAHTALTNAGAVIHYRFDDLNAFAASVPEVALQGLERNPNIISIEPDPKRYPIAQQIPYGIDMVRARDVWDTDRDGVVDSGAPSGNGRMICVIDSGVDVTHSDLAGVNFVGGYTTSTPWNTDSCGHGTHVTGTLTAVNNTTGVVGVNPGDVAIYAVKVFDGGSCGWTYSSDLVDAARRCRDAGANIISMSLGGSLKSRNEDRAFNDLYTNDNILPVAAAGNSGNTSKSYPASYDSVISVAAVDSNQVVASFSQQNSAVELAAPGVGVLSTLPGNNYAYWSGTSMATPHVSGVAALVWSANPGWTNVDLRYALTTTALDLGAAGRDVAYGYGLVQADAALDWLNAMAVGGTVDQPPVASFAYNCVGKDCAFDASASYDPENGAMTFDWDFGDGSTLTSGTNPLTNHTFSTDGPFVVVLTVTDNQDNSATQSKTIGFADLVISNVTSNKKKGNAFAIQWITNTPATSAVIFTCCGEYSDTALVTNHNMSFRGSAGVLYEYRVRSEANGKVVESGPYYHQN